MTISPVCNPRVTGLPRVMQAVSVAYTSDEILSIPSCPCQAAPSGTFNPPPVRGARLFTSTQKHEPSLLDIPQKSEWDGRVGT